MAKERKKETKEERRIRLEEKRFAWVVAYINWDHVDRCERELKRYPEYKKIEAFIPTIKVLKKQFKNKDHFDEVPLLFQYGFFKIPREYAIHYLFLENLQKNISCIFGWVKDNLRKAGPGKIPVAIATSKEISDLVRATNDLGAHNSDDLSMLKPGDYIVLKGYPWEGLECEFVSLNEKKKRVVVKTVMFMQTKEMEVPYEAVFFNIYSNRGYDDSLTIKNSLDEMEKKGTLHKKMKKRYGNEDK